MGGKRPPSLSDSNIYVGDYKFESIEEFHLQIHNYDKTAGFMIDDTVINTPKYLALEIIIDYAMRFNFHILLISIFEILFYFTFVSKDEDAGILHTTAYYTQSIINSCTNLTGVEIIYLNSLLNKIINSSQILETGVEQAKLRVRQNTDLYNLSLYYVGIIGFVQLGLLTINYLCKFQIHWKHIILENFALVSFLGLYELMFFETIIKKYNAETPEEISALFISGLQGQCKLLT
jgi:hypothetical protein